MNGVGFLNVVSKNIIIIIIIIIIINCSLLI